MNTKIITSTLLSTPDNDHIWCSHHQSSVVQYNESAHDIKFRNGILKREIWNLEKEIGLSGWD